MGDTTASALTAKEPLTAALAGQWEVIGALLAGLTAPQWAAATPLPGWRVHDIAAHIVGTEQMLSGIECPVSADELTQLEHVRNPVGLFCERWVASFRGCTLQQILGKYREITAQRTHALEAMTQSEFDAPTDTLSGPVSYGRFMRVRLYDCWFHEHDIRDAIGIPGDETGSRAEHAVAELLEPSGPAFSEEGGLGPALGHRVRAPRGSTVTFALSGPIETDIHVAVDDRACVVATLDAPATATIRLPSTVFTRLCGGRTRALDHRDRIAVLGDEGLGRRVLENMSVSV